MSENVYTYSMGNVLKVGDLVVNTNTFPLAFSNLKTFMKPNEIAVVIGVDVGNWVRLRTESGIDGWYLNFFGYLRILGGSDLTSPVFRDIIDKKE
jgi:hypothetical protein